METRNLIKFGPSSYVVSLPHGWIKKNRLKKGNFLFLEEQGNNLIFSPVETAHDQSKIFNLDIDGKSDEHITKMLKSSYLTNYNTFVLHGKTVKTRAKYIREVLSQLVAVEIMEQTSQKIVAHEMLDKSKNSPEKIIRRMDMIIRSMLEWLQEERSSDIRYIHERESDLNRLDLLAQRLIVNSFDNPSYLTELKKSNFEILMEFKVMGFLEMIGDSIRDLAETAGLMKLVKLEPLPNISKRYLKTMEIYYANDLDAAVQLSIQTKQAKIDLEKGTMKTRNMSEIMMPLKEIILMTDEIALVVINRNT
jgi:phosphate uptake regulator